MKRGLTVQNEGKERGNDSFLFFFISLFLFPIAQELHFLLLKIFIMDLGENLLQRRALTLRVNEFD